MRLTTKGRFAVTAMIDLALRESAGSVSLGAISQRQSISLSYLEQLFAKLKKAELVESIRGPGGGYKLGRAAKDISIAEVIIAVDEALDATACGGEDSCHGGDGECMTHDLWAALNEKIIEFLSSISLQKMVDAQTERGIVLADEVAAGVKKLVKVPLAAKPIRVQAPRSVFALGGMV